MHSNESALPKCILTPKFIATTDMYIHSSRSDTLHPSSGCLQALGRQAELQSLSDLAVVERQLLQFKDKVDYDPQWDAKDLHQPVWACHLSFAPIKH